MYICFKKAFRILSDYLGRNIQHRLTSNNQAYLSIRPLASLSVCLSFTLSVCLSVFHSVCLSLCIYLFLCACGYLSIYGPVRTSELKTLSSGRNSAKRFLNRWTRTNEDERFLYSFWPESWRTAKTQLQSKLNKSVCSICQRVTGYFGNFTRYKLFSSRCAYECKLKQTIKVSP